MSTSIEYSEEEAAAIFHVTQAEAAIVGDEESSPALDAAVFQLNQIAGMTADRANAIYAAMEAAGEIGYMCKCCSAIDAEIEARID